jgi:hypothetical protein
MDEDMVFAKTERGQREIALPGGELPSKLRRLLIMVDGAKSVGDLAPMTRPGEIGPTVDALLRGGYIIATDGDGSPPPEEDAA